MLLKNSTAWHPLPPTSIAPLWSRSKRSKAKRTRDSWFCSKWVHTEEGEQDFLVNATKLASAICLGVRALADICMYMVHPPLTPSTCTHGCNLWSRMRQEAVFFSKVDDM